MYTLVVESFSLGAAGILISMAFCFGKMQVVSFVHHA